MVIIKPENITLDYFDFTYEKTKEKMKKATYKLEIKLENKSQIHTENRQYRETFENLFLKHFGNRSLMNRKKPEIEIDSETIDEKNHYFIRSQSSFLSYIPIISHALDLIDLIFFNGYISINSTISSKTPHIAQFRIYHEDYNQKRLFGLYQEITKNMGINISEDAEKNRSKLEMLLTNSKNSMDDYYKLLQVSNMIAKSNSNS